MTLDEFKQFIEEVFRPSDIRDGDTKITYTIQGVQVELDVSFTDAVITKLGTYSKNETEISLPTYYEILIRNNTRIPLARERDYSCEDATNKIKYKIGKPSDEYVFHFIEIYLNTIRTQSTNQPIRRFFDTFRLRRMRERESSQPSLLPYNVLDMIRDSIARLETIQVESENALSKSQFERNSLAYLFNIGYNTGNSIYPLKSIDEFISPIRIGFIRRANSEDIEPPRRQYINDLIYHYQKGISSESIDHQYLSFYHVFEHFFDNVYNEDLITRVRGEITKPGFSYKRNKDIEYLVKIIQIRVKLRNDEFQISSEQDALELTLKKYIPEIKEVKNDTVYMNRDLLNYFKTSEVPFSKGSRVNFDIDNEDEIYKNLAKRIYLTRNSIVHSKDNDKSKYQPFKDDKDLVPEVLLLRSLSERIIINTSKEI